MRMLNSPGFPPHRQWPRRNPGKRRGIVLAVILAGMGLVLLMLGGLARRAVIEHRAIDSRTQSLQADWLLWSAKQKALAEIEHLSPLPSDWKSEWKAPGLGKSASARFLRLENAATSKATQVQVEVRWTSDSGATIERSQVFSLPSAQ
jgi:hypothetical protein